MSKKPFLTVREIVLFGIFPALITASQLLLSVLPNIHLTGMFVMLMTLLFRWKALFPLYVYVFLEGVVQGFHPWWIPYLYVWTVLWALTMLLPKRLPDGVAAVCYCALGLMHGLFFEVLWIPFYMTFEGLTFDMALVRLAYGVGFSVTHGVGNVVSCTLAIPLIRLVRRLES